MRENARPDVSPARSPNHGERRSGATPDMVVLHYTGMHTAAAALERLCDPAAEVSAHYLIDLDGTVHALVPEDRRAWHAGRAAWGGVADVNSHSIGIELANPGLGPTAHPFPNAQMCALERLLGGVMRRHGIRRERVVGHACIAPGRKVDPGPRFDWRRLARQELSVWPATGRYPDDSAAPAARFQAAALRFGYPVPQTGDWDDETLAVWRAFADRFCPACAPLPGAARGVEKLEDLATRWPVRGQGGA